MFDSWPLFEWWTALTASPHFWLGLLAFAILMYVILDGFDLGLGILFPWFDCQSQRKVMLNSIAPFWDGNETWLVFGGVILFAAFPSAYGLILSSNYLPIIVMLLALVARGSAIEYRSKAQSSTHQWDRLFTYGSSIATFCQGYILGQLVEAGQSIIWLKTAFSVGCGFALMAGYALLGCCWLLIKQRQTSMLITACQLGYKLTVTLLVCMMLVSGFTLLSNPNVWQLWFDWPVNLLILPIPLLTLALGVWLCNHFSYLEKTLAWPVDSASIDNIHVLNQQALRLPFVLTVMLFMAGFLGLWLGMTPNIVPSQLTIYEAIAPQNSLTFVSIGVVFLLPIILCYTMFGYKVFSNDT